MNIKYGSQRKTIFSLAMLGMMTFSSHANAHGYFVDTVVIDIQDIKTNLVQEIKKHGKWIYELDNHIMKMTRDIELFNDDVIEENKIAAANIASKTNGASNIFNSKVISSFTSAAAQLCWDGRASTQIALAQCQTEYDSTKSLVDADLSRVNMTPDERRQAVVDLAKNIKKLETNKKSHGIQYLPSMMKSKMDKESYDMALDIIKKRNGFGKYDLTVQTDFEKDVGIESIAGGELQESYRVEKNKLEKQMAYLMQSKAIHLWGYKGEVSVLDGLYALGTSEFGNDQAYRRAKLNDTIINRATPVVWKNTLTNASKRLYLKLERYQQILAIESALGYSILKKSNQI